MWTNLFLDTANEDFPTTLSSEVDLSDWSSRPSSIPRSARVWGSNDVARNREAFDKMRKGDYILLYRVDKGVYGGAGIIDATHKTDWFANQYWSEQNSNRRLAYFMSSFRELDKSVIEINNIIGYEDIYHPHGLQRVADNREVADVIEELGLDKR